MSIYTFPQSVRKHIRLFKATIRRQVLDVAEQERRISKFYEDMIQRYQTKGAKAKASVSPITPSKPQEAVSSKKEK
ncbi:MAG: hypothetical protein Q7S62_00830 [bacterium]|nr:hypothetical protein [bacterium]